MDEVVSTEIEILKLEYANLTDYSNYQTMFVDLGYELKNIYIKNQIGFSIESNDELNNMRTIYLNNYRN